MIVSMFTLCITSRPESECTITDAIEPQLSVHIVDDHGDRRSCTMPCKGMNARE